MKTLLITVMILIISSFVFADEVSVTLSRLAFLEPPQEDLDTESSRLAVFFNLPEEIDGRDIVYAELFVELDFGRLIFDGNSTLELRAYSITTAWDENDADWDDLAHEMDTLLSTSYTVDLANDSTIFMDITDYIKGVVEDDAINQGLMFIPNKFEQRAFHLNRNIVNQIENNARVRIVYQ